MSLAPYNMCLRLSIFLSLLNFVSPSLLHITELPEYKIASKGGFGGSVLGLSDFEYSLNRITKSSKSFCRSYRRSRLFFCSSGLYRLNSSSSVGWSHIVRAGPPTQITPPLYVNQCVLSVGQSVHNRWVANGATVCDLRFAPCDFCLRLVGRSVGPECRGKLTQRSSSTMFRVLTNAPPSWVPDVSVMPIGNARISKG